MFAETAGGAWTQAFNAIGDVMEQIGSGVEKTSGFAKFLKEGAEGMNMILSSEDLSGWEKLGVIFGFNNKAAKKLSDSISFINKKNQENRAIVDGIMQEHVKSVADAQYQLQFLTNIQKGSYQELLKQELEAYIKRTNAAKLDQEEGYNPLPAIIINDPHAQLPDPSLDPHLGTHAAIMEVTGTPVRITEIAEHYELSTEELNRILRVNNCQEILKSGKSVYYTPVGEGKYYAYAPKVVSRTSPIVGKLRIDGWFFNQPSFKSKLDIWVAEYKSAMEVPSPIEA